MTSDLPANLEIPLWRLRLPHQRRAAVRPFIGHRVRLERWWDRTEKAGSQTYEGVILTVALSTTGSAADFVILQTDGDTVWAISTAQVASIKLVVVKATVRRSSRGTA